MFRLLGLLVRLAVLVLILLVVAVILCMPTTPPPNAKPTSDNSMAARSTRHLSPKDKLAAAIVAVIGDSNRGVARVSEVRISGDRGRRVIAVTLSANDNLTTGMVRKGAILDVSEILRVVHDSGIGYRTLSVTGTYPLQDEFGNTTVETVVRGTFTRQNVERINWENFMWENTPTIADSWYVHAALR